jgi:hypothetical protein
MQNLTTPADYWDFLAKNPHNIDRKIGIIYAGRSGSMMLSGLLDGHDHLISMNCYSDQRLFTFLCLIAKKQETITTKYFIAVVKANINHVFDMFFKYPLLSEDVRKKKSL